MKPFLPPFCPGGLFVEEPVAGGSVFQLAQLQVQLQQDISFDSLMAASASGKFEEDHMAT